MATTQTELLINGVVVATRNTAPFLDFGYTIQSSDISANATVAVREYIDGSLGGTTPVVNGVISSASFSPSTISAEYTYHKLDVATTDATAIGAVAMSSTDSLTQTTYNASLNSTVEEQNGKECIDIRASGRYFRLNNSNALYQDTFSIFFQAKLNDKIPDATGALWHIEGTNDKFQVLLLTDGRIQIGYESGGNEIIANSVDPVFADGASADFEDISVTLISGGSLSLNVNGSNIPMDVSDISGIDMSVFNSAGVTSVLERRLGTTSSLRAPGYLRNVIIQPVGYTSQNITNLRSL